MSKEEPVKKSEPKEPTPKAAEPKASEPAKKPPFKPELPKAQQGTPPAAALAASRKSTL